MRRRTGLAVSLAVVCAVVAGLVVAITALVAGAATAGAREVLDRLQGADRAVRLTTPLAADPAGQDPSMRALIASLLGDGGREVPVDIVRDVQPQGSVSVAGAAGRLAGQIAVASVADLAQVATLTAGSWPTDADGATVHADAAAALGIGVGDALDVAGAAVTVTGLWRVTDPDDPRWFGSGLWSGGTDGTSRGPVVVDETRWQQIDAQPLARFTVVPRIGELRADDLDAVVRLSREARAQAADDGLGAVSVRARFAVATEPLSAELAALRTAAPLSLAVVAAVAALTLWQLLGLLARTRDDEHALLRVRGADPRILALRAGTSAAVVAAGGAAVGAGIAAAVTVSAAGARDAAASGALGSLWVVAAVALAVGAASVVRTARASDAGGARARWSALGVTAVLAAAAVAATWQLLSQGPVTGLRRADVDPIAVAAPALLLVAILAAGYVTLGAAAARAARREARRDADALAARSVARQLLLVAAPVVAVGLAVGQIVTAAGYAATWEQSYERMRDLAAGAAVRVDSPRALPATTVEALAAVPGVTGVAPVAVSDAVVTGENAPVVEVAPAALAQLGLSGLGAVDPAALAEQIDVSDALPALAVNAASLSVRIEGAPSAASVWIADAWGQVVEVPLAAAPDDTWVAAVPATGHPPWRLLAVDAVPASVAPPLDGSSPTSLVRLASLSTDAGDIPAPTAWWSLAFSGADVIAAASGTDAAATAAGAPDPLVRFVPVAAVPVVVSAALAEAIGVDADASVTVQPGVGQPEVYARVAGVAAAIPGSDRGTAMLVDARAAAVERLRTVAAPAAASGAWLEISGAADNAAVVAALREQVRAPAAVRVLDDDPADSMLATAAVALWIAAAGCVVLAACCVVAACAAALALRRADVAVLRAIGVSAAAQARIRRRELWIACGWGAGCGAVAGVLVWLVAVPTLARAGIPEPFPTIATEPRLDLVPVLAAGAVLVAVVASIVAGYGRAVAREARHALPAGAP